MNAEVVALCKQRRWDEVWDIARRSSLDWCANLSQYLERQNADMKQAATCRRFTRALQLYPVAKGANLRMEVPTHQVSAAMAEFSNYDWTRDSTGQHVTIQTRPPMVWSVTSGQQIDEIPELIDPGNPPTAAQQAWINKDSAPRPTRSVGRDQLVLVETNQGTWSFTPTQSHLWRGMRIAPRPWAGNRAVLHCSSGALILDATGLAIQDLYIGCNRDISMGQNGDIYVDSFKPIQPEVMQLYFSSAGPPLALGQLTETQKGLIGLSAKLGDPISDFFAALLAVVQ